MNTDEMMELRRKAVGSVSQMWASGVSTEILTEEVIVYVGALEKEVFGDED